MKNKKLIISCIAAMLSSCGGKEGQNKSSEARTENKINIISDETPKKTQNDIIKQPGVETPDEIKNSPAKSVPQEPVHDESRFEKNPSKAELDALAREVLEILKKEDEEAQHQGKVDAAFMKIKNDKKIMIMGDMHGCLEALLCIPVAEKTLQEGGAVVILGDMIDQHIPFGPELALRCLYEALSLKKKYPKNVIVLRGNHESYYNYSYMGYSIDPNHCSEIVRKCIEHLPLACVIENNGKKYFCVHGGICEEMYKKHSERDNFGLTKFQELPRIEYSQILPDTTPENNKINFHALWNDFQNQTDSRRQNVAPLVGPFLTKTGYTAIFRGHDPFQTPDPQLTNKVYTILSNSFISGNAISKNDPRRARYAIIEGGNVQVVYFIDTLIDGNSIEQEEFVKKCTNSLRSSN